MDQNQSVTARFEYRNPNNCGKINAKAGCLSPTQSPEYYIDQNIKYFLTMESNTSPLIIPNYSKKVVRWEWPPWLLLTGYGSSSLIWTDLLLKLNPTTYPVLNCEAFDTQPFGRCHVVFDYSGELCPIYEEFTFNDKGEITFIEAWIDAPGWIPMKEHDYWAEGENVDRLATKVPGLGNETGLIDIHSDWVKDAAAKDADISELVRRTKKPVSTWAYELITHIEEVRHGCDPDNILHKEE